MSGLANLTPEIINAITRNLPVSDFTRAELRNFLNGRITTVTDEGEFTNALKGLTQDIEVGTSLPPGQATGEIIGALEGGAIASLAGGAIIYKGAEIASQLTDLLRGTREEKEARETLFDQIRRERERGVVHGAQGSPTRNIEDLIRQQAEQQRFGKQGSGGETEREFKFGDPGLRQRKRPIVDDGGGDGGEDAPLLSEDKEDDKKNTDRTGRGPIGIPPAGVLPKSVNSYGRRPYVPPTDRPDDTVENINDPIVARSESWLRPEFDILGTAYFSKKITPIDVENSEWTEFDYVHNFDKYNGIELDNILNLAVRFREPLFLPEYVPPERKPTNEAIRAKAVPMQKVLQLTQPFMDKFDSADMGRPTILYPQFDHTGFDKNFSKLRIYNPI